MTLAISIIKEQKRTTTKVLVSVRTQITNSFLIQRKAVLLCFVIDSSDRMDVLFEIVTLTDNKDCHLLNIIPHTKSISKKKICKTNNSTFHHTSCPP